MRTPRWGSLVGEALRTALPWRTVMPTVIYCLRTLAAVALALYTSFSLQLEAPLSSVVTVLIVANPVTGALVSKSVWRLLGTFIGAVAAVVLMAFFAQSPILFDLAFSICIGLACIASTLLRFYKAYGAVLAGYTIIIVCAPAFVDPQTIFVSALARLSAVSVGIASAALVFLLTNIRAPVRLGNVTLALIRNTGLVLSDHAIQRATPSAEIGRDAPPGSLSLSFYDQRGALLAQANGLVEIIEYAAADSFAVAQRAGRLRLGTAGLMGTLTALNPFYGRLGRHEALADEVRPAVEALASLDLGNPGPTLDRLAAARDRLAARYDAPRQTEPHADDLDHLGALEHAHDLLTRLHLAISNLTAHPRRSGGNPDIRLRLFLDWPTALRNGLRGSIVTILALLFWYVTQWPTGPTLLAYLVPASCLLATNPSASRASIDFATGTLMAIPASILCEALLLPQITGFPLLVGALSICMLPGIWFQFHARHGLRAFGYVVFFNAMITVNNPITFNDIGLLNTWLAFIMGTGALIIVFRALLPSNPVRDSNRLVHSITRAVARLGRTRTLPIIAVWENLQMQKALRLIQRLQPMGPHIGHDILDCALVTIELGRDLLRLRQMLAETTLEPPERDAALAVLAATVRLRQDPRHAAMLAREAASLIAGRLASSCPLDTDLPPPGLRRITALLHEIERLIDAVPAFLMHDYAVPRC